MLKNEAVGLLSAEEVGIKKYLLVGMDYSMNIGSNLNVTVGDKNEITCGASKLTMDSSGKTLSISTDISINSQGPLPMYRMASRTSTARAMSILMAPELT